MGKTNRGKIKEALKTKVDENNSHGCVTLREYLKTQLKEIIKEELHDVFWGEQDTMLPALGKISTNLTEIEVDEEGSYELMVDDKATPILCDIIDYIFEEK